MDHLGIALALGLALGLRHAMDPDHIAAVSAVVSRSPRFATSWLLGACWGLGHALTLFLAGAGVIALKGAIPAFWDAALEFSAAAMLVALGSWNLRGLKTRRDGGLLEHSHPHAHDGEHAHRHAAAAPVEHAHVHAHSPLEALLRAAGAAGSLRAFGIGALHGLAGSSAAVLLAAAAIGGPRASIAYLAVFVAGTFAGMLWLSAIMGLAMARAAERWSIEDRIVPGAGAVSLSLGLYMMYRAVF